LKAQIVLDQAPLVEDELILRSIAFEGRVAIIILRRSVVNPETTAYTVLPLNLSPNSALEFPNTRTSIRASGGLGPDRFKGKTVVRGGFGIYHGAAQNDDRNAALRKRSNGRISSSSTRGA